MTTTSLLGAILATVMLVSLGAGLTPVLAADDYNTALEGLSEPTTEYITGENLRRIDVVFNFITSTEFVYLVLGMFVILVIFSAYLFVAGIIFMIFFSGSR